MTRMGQNGYLYRPCLIVFHICTFLAQLHLPSTFLHISCIFLAHDYIFLHISAHSCTFLHILALFCTFLHIFCTFLHIFCTFLHTFCTFLHMIAHSCTWLHIFAHAHKAPPLYSTSHLITSPPPSPPLQKKNRQDELLTNQRIARHSNFMRMRNFNIHALAHKTPPLHFRLDTYTATLTSTAKKKKKVEGNRMHMRKKITPRIAPSILQFKVT